MTWAHAIDLHMHTTVSDGTDTPAEILRRVKEAGIELFSVTDHDAIKGSATLLSLSTADDPAFVTGVEFSCKDEQGKYHILGYGYDPDAPSIRQTVESGHNYRMNKVHARLLFLEQRFGYSFPEEELSALFAMDNPGKPHIGNLMVKYGYAGTKEEAIRDYINQLHISGQYLRPEEAVAGILAAGGVPILAHPVFGDGGQLIVGEALEERIRRLMGFGLKGVEAFYSGFSGEQKRDVLLLAEQYGLYVTAGSDYHGTNKRVSLGDTGLGDADKWPDGLYRFFDAVRKEPKKAI